MSVFVHYRVPLMVEVSTSEILSVHVDDEAIEGPLNVQDHDDEPVKRVTRQRAIEIAETEKRPGWTSGF